jgi:hypothetical protein
MTEQSLTDLEKDRVIEMAWKTELRLMHLLQFGPKEQEVIDDNEMKNQKVL